MRKFTVEEPIEKNRNNDNVVMGSFLYPLYNKIINKEFYFIATAADSNNRMLDRTFECFRGFTDCLTGATEKGCLYASGIWNKEEVKSTRYIEDAYNMGLNA